MEFPGIVGNESVKESLSLAVAEQRLPHAILLEGEPGSGRHAMAKQLAMAAVCSAQPEARPCGECPHCVKSKAGSHPDIFVVEGGAAARSFHVDVIREIRSDAFIKPNEAACKVYLLFGAQAMSPQAQNALLKVLEEPPAQVFFILTCNTAAELLPTVRSRTQIFSLEAPVGWDEEESRAIACQAGEIAKAATASREAELLSLTGNLVKDRERFRAVLGRLVWILRDACVRRVGGVTLLSDQRDAVMALCQNATKGQLLAMLQVVQEIQKQQERNANATLLTTCFCAQLRRAAGK